MLLMKMKTFKKVEIILIVILNKVLSYLMIKVASYLEAKGNQMPVGQFKL